MSKRLLYSFALIVAMLGSAAHATPEADKARDEIKKAFGFVPGFFKSFPDESIPGLWQELGGFQANPKTALSPKVKDLIGLAVAAQIPCRYCIYFHTEFAKLEGASANEIGIAVAEAGLTRQWSTIINGGLPDEAAFRAMVDKWLAYAKNPAGGPATPPPNDVTLAEVDKMFGSVPDFIAHVAPTALPGAWQELKDVELSETTSVDPKTKSLIGIAVAAQIPCRYCLIADTAFAKLQGATDQEINEAITMSSLVRNLSTMMNGLQVDEAAFKRDVDHIVRDAKKMAGK